MNISILRTIPLMKYPIYLAPEMVKAPNAGSRLPKSTNLTHFKLEDIKAVCTKKSSNIFTKLLIFFSKSILNGLKRIKNTKPATPNICRSPVPPAGSRPFLYLVNVITSYHTEFHQILSINKTVNQKGVLVPWKKWPPPFSFSKIIDFSRR